MSGNSNGEKAIKAGIGYTIGNILIRGVSFLLLPIFSRLMDTDQFGIYNAFLSYDSILYVITGMALHSSVKSAHYTFKGKIDEYVSSVSLIYIINFTIFNIIAIVFGKKLSALLDLPILAIYMLLVYSSGTALLTLYNNRISLDYSYKKYLTISFINTIGNIGLSLLLILTVFNSQRSLGRIVGTSTVIGIIAIYILAYFYKKAKPKYKKDYWKFGIIYSLPIIPHGISQVLLSQFDRIMIRSMVSDSATGIYSLAANLKIILNVISESISTAWSTWFFEEIDKGNTKSIQKRAVQMVCLFGVLVIGLMAISPELILFLGGKEYINGKYVAIPMLIDCFILFMYNIIVPSEYYTKKTKYIMIGTMLSATINVITNYIFILKYGYYAAAYTTLFSYICYVLLHMVISKKLVGFHVLPPAKILPVTISIILCATSDLLLIDVIIIRLCINAIIISLWIVYLYRQIKKEGIDIISVLLRKLKSR